MTSTIAVEELTKTIDDVNVNEANDNDDIARVYDAHDTRIKAYVVALGVVIFLGLIFNTVAFVVFVRSPTLRRTTTARYLIALTIADSTYLAGEWVHWRVRHGPGPCKFVTDKSTTVLFDCILMTSTSFLCLYEVHELKSN